jgi:hypothetical protein
MTDDAERDSVALRWSIALMSRAFRDLAVSFAAIDGPIAAAAIQRIEADIAINLRAFREKPPEGITRGIINAAMLEIVPPLREMTQGARQLVQQIGKPKN